MEGELLDWEMVHGSDTESTDSITSNKKKSASSSVIDDGMMILSDHLSAGNIPDDATTDQSQYGVMESGDSLRVAYGSEPPNPVEVLGFDQLNVNQSGDDCVGNQLGFCDDKTGISSDGEVRVSDFEADDDEKHVESEAVAELTGEILSHHEDPSKCLSESDNLEVADGSQSDVEEQIEDSSKSWFDSGGSELVSGVVNGEEEIVSDSGVASTEAIEGSEGNTVQAVAVNSGDESKSRETVWWKMPFVLLKYSAFRIGPVWSVSMAAAVMGIVLLGRRLYNMKKKAQRFHLKVSIDDKKVSRVMSQAARLNEVFTEVRRVPVIRPALPSPGAWPVLSLR